MWDIFWPPAIWRCWRDGADETRVEQTFAFAIQSMAWGPGAFLGSVGGGILAEMAGDVGGLVGDRGGLRAVAAAAQTSRLSTSASVSARRTTAASAPSTSTVAGRGRALKFAADTSS